MARTIFNFFFGTNFFWRTIVFLNWIEEFQEDSERYQLKIGEKRGLRYSWGYPSCPDVSQHRLVWKLLEPEKSGMTLTEAGQIVPEQSTAAIVVHHPEAEYFTI